MSEIGQKIIASVRAKAVEAPGYIYTPVPTPDIGVGNSEGCLYVVDGCPSCIVGYGLWDAGVIDASIEFEGRNLYAFADFNIMDFPFMQDLSGAELHWLGVVQAEQDRGTAWGAAVDHADDVFPL